MIAAALTLEVSDVTHTLSKTRFKRCSRPATAADDPPRQFWKQVSANRLRLIFGNRGADDSALLVFTLLGSCVRFPPRRQSPDRGSIYCRSCFAFIAHGDERPPGGGPEWVDKCGRCEARVGLSGRWLIRSSPNEL